jgi:cyclopropane fatty-acyl-phospholipid synthase-like methyltransferase
MFIFVTAEQCPAFFANLKNALMPDGLLLIEGYRAHCP